MTSSQYKDDQTQTPTDIIIKVDKEKTFYV